MLRVRFYCNREDYRPVNWPIQHPYWCTGYSDTHAVIVAYVTDKAELLRNWPDAVEIDILQNDLTEYKFNGRFQRPEWFK